MCSSDLCAGLLPAKHLSPSHKGDFKPPLPIQNNPLALPKHDKTPSRDSDPKPPQAQCSYPGLDGMEFSRLVHVEEQPNGGALVAHAYNSELVALTPQERQRFAQEFVTLTFSEDQAQAAHYVMGIVHGAACYLPDFLDYFSCKFPSSHVKMEILGKKDIETTTMANFTSQVGGPGLDLRTQRGIGWVK